MALNHSPEFCIKLTYRYLLKAGHVPGDTWVPGGQFWPQRHNLNKLGRGLLGHTTYQISRLLALWFQTRRFLHDFPYISLCKTCNTQAGLFWPQGHILNKLSRGSLGHATYQISKL